MTARGTSAGCAGSSSSCCATACTSSALPLAATIAVALLACGNARPPPPAHLDPEYADAGPAVILHEPWPQTGPFYCHDVAALDGTRASMCSRSREACTTWREGNARRGYTVSACSEEVEASCFLPDAQRELCFRTLDKCEEIREAMQVGGLCRTVRAIWKPE